MIIKTILKIIILAALGVLFITINIFIVSRDDECIYENIVFKDNSNPTILGNKLTLTYSICGIKSTADRKYEVIFHEGGYSNKIYKIFSADLRLRNNIDVDASDFKVDWVENNIILIEYPANLNVLIKVDSIGEYQFKYFIFNKMSNRLKRNNIANPSNKEAKVIQILTQHIKNEFPDSSENVQFGAPVEYFLNSKTKHDETDFWSVEVFLDRERRYTYIINENSGVVTKIK